MSEITSLDSYDTHMATHSERASIYIDAMSAEDREAAISMAKTFQNKDRPVAKTAVLIPVAAHQDGSYIMPTLGEYAKQKTDHPFTIFLSLNAPLDTADMKSVMGAEAAVDEARAAYPQLDVRSSSTIYSDPTIGLIRRDLWNAAFLLSHYEHGFSEDVIGINNDIDAHYISPHYIARIQQHYERRLESRRRLLGDAMAKNALQASIATRVSHATIPSHPNTAKVTTWVDNTYFQSPDRIGYEAGLAIPFSTYAQTGGFNGQSVTHETARLYGNSLPFLSGAQLYTSPRRYIDRLREHDTSEIWTDDSFGSDDTCRGALPPDISQSRAEEVIFERLSSDMEEHWLPGAALPVLRGARIKNFMGEMSHDEILSQTTRSVTRQLSKADRLLRKVVKTPLLADIARESYDAESYVAEQMSRFGYNDD